MMKDSYYFSHDCNARNDPRMLDVRAKFGWHGYGLYWAIIEVMREQKDYMISESSLPGIAFGFGMTFEEFIEFVDGCTDETNPDQGLFVKKDGKLYSESLLRRMMKRNHSKTLLSNNGKKGADKRWKEEPEREKKKETKKPQEQKVKYADGVSMRSVDYETLLSKYGKEAVDRMIEILDNYKLSKGKSYKDDYRAILSWVVGRYTKERDEKLKKQNYDTGTNSVEAKVAARRRLDENFLNS